MEVIMMHSGDAVMKVKKAGKVPVFLEFAFYWHESDLNRWLLNYDGDKCFGKVSADLHPSCYSCSVDVPDNH